MSSRGWTLIEMLVATAGALILGAVLVTIYQTQFKALAVLTARSLVTADLRVALGQVGRDIRAAQGKPLACGAYAASGTVLLLDVPGVGNCVVYRYNPAGLCTPTSTPGTMERIVSPGLPRIVICDVVALSFINPPPPNKQVTVTLGSQKRYQAFVVASNLTDTFVLRGIPDP